MLARLKKLLPDAADDALLTELLAQAEAFLLAYTRRRTLPQALESACVRYAAVLYNRMGMEGEQAHAEGTVSRTAEGLPAELRAAADGWRLAHTPGSAEE